MTETCQRCKEEDEDHRTVWMACFYDMDKLGLPLDKIIIEEEGTQSSRHRINREFFTIRICKNCRSDYLHAIQAWFNAPKTNRECGSGIWIRDLGTIKEVTEEEYRELYPDREPVRVKHEYNNK